MPTSSSQFNSALAKIWIASIDRPEIVRRNDSSIQADLEFNGVTKRSMQIELLFDGYENGESVEPDVRVLEVLSTVWNPEASDEDERRPHHCLVGWGVAEDAMRPFCCVIESLATKYTMWSSNGTPLRATCTLKLKQAHRLSRARAPDLRYDVKRRTPSWERPRRRA